MAGEDIGRTGDPLDVPAGGASVHNYLSATDGANDGQPERRPRRQPRRAVACDAI
jgi:hypothetical protein